MLIPTKFTSLEESTIFKMRALLEGNAREETVSETMERTAGAFQDTSEFLHAMDVLYVLKMIDFDTATDTIIYAD